MPANFGPLSLFIMVGLYHRSEGRRESATLGLSEVSTLIQRHSLEQFSTTVCILMARPFLVESCIEFNASPLVGLGADEQLEVGGHMHPTCIPCGTRIIV